MTKWWRLHSPLTVDSSLFFFLASDGHSGDCDVMVRVAFGTYHRLEVHFLGRLWICKDHDSIARRVASSTHWFFCIYICMNFVPFCVDISDFPPFLTSQREESIIVWRHLDWLFFAVAYLFCIRLPHVAFLFANIFIFICKHFFFGLQIFFVVCKTFFPFNFILFANTYIFIMRSRRLFLEIPWWYGCQPPIANREVTLANVRIGASPMRVNEVFE